MSQNEQIEKGTSFILVGKICIILLAAVQEILIPRILGPQSMGFYSYWLSILLIFGTVFGLGGLSVLSRYLPELRIKSETSIRPLTTRMQNIIISKTMRTASLEKRLCCARYRMDLLKHVGSSYENL